MALTKYGILFKKYLKELNPIKYSKLTLDGSLMDYLYEEEKYLCQYADSVKSYLKKSYPEPQTHGFLVMARYNNMIESMIGEYIRSEIMRIL